MNGDEDEDEGVGDGGGCLVDGVEENGHHLPPILEMPMPQDDYIPQSSWVVPRMFRHLRTDFRIYRLRYVDEGTPYFSTEALTPLAYHSN
ncbi:hypothetical protein DOY81_008382 [Sarcophaga bullata]|nr:hypothetical protein DOY81_008382 [Sarcophaga bullata]